MRKVRTPDDKRVRARFSACRERVGDARATGHRAGLLGQRARRSAAGCFLRARLVAGLLLGSGRVVVRIVAGHGVAADGECCGESKYHSGCVHQIISGFDGWERLLGGHKAFGIRIVSTRHRCDQLPEKNLNTRVLSVPCSRWRASSKKRPRPFPARPCVRGGGTDRRAHAPAPPMTRRFVHVPGDGARWR